MAFVLDLMHLIAATLLAVVGLGYEREEECDPVQFQPAAYVMEADAQAPAMFTQVRFTQARADTDCEAQATFVSYPVL
jgi:hypothetical protein